MKPKKVTILDWAGRQFAFESLEAATKALSVISKCIPVSATYPNGYSGAAVYRDVAEDHYTKTAELRTGQNYLPGQKAEECEIVEGPARPLSKASRKYIASLDTTKPLELTP